MLREAELEDELIELGWEAWRNLAELFGDLPPITPSSPTSARSARRTYRTIASASARAIPRCRKTDARRRSLLLGLALNLAPARDRLVDCPKRSMGKLVHAHQLFATKLPKAAAGAIEFFEPGRYLASLSVRDNLIFGRVVPHHGRANERLGELITSVADDRGFRDQVVAAGLDFAVGIGGANLSRSSARSWCSRPPC